MFENGKGEFKAFSNLSPPPPLQRSFAVLLDLMAKVVMEWPPMAPQTEDTNLKARPKAQRMNEWLQVM